MRITLSGSERSAVSVPKTLKLMLVILVVAAQVYAFPQTAKKVEGLVVDQNGAPISGAEVTVAGKTTTTATTDSEGKFSFDASGTAAMITIHARGFETASRVWNADDRDSSKVKIALTAEHLSDQ